MKLKTRKCYCNLKEEDSLELINKDIPEGYCCLCSRCNKPGHIRVDSSGTAVYALCDACYQKDKAIGVAKVLGLIVLVVITALLNRG